MRLGERTAKRQLRAAEVARGPEQGEQFEAEKIIRQVISVASERLGGVERLRISPESAFLIKAAHPELVAQLFPKPTELAGRQHEKLKALEGRGSVEDFLNEATLLAIGDWHGSYKGKRGELERLFDTVSKQIKEFTGHGESPKRLVRRVLFLARFFPEKKLELAQLLRWIQPEILDMLDDDALDPNYQRPTIAGMLRLLDPAARLTLQDTLEPHLPAWKEEVERWLSPEIVSKYSNRGLQHYLDQALQAAAGIEVLTAQEASISDAGELVVVSGRPLIQSSQPLPDRAVH